MTQAQFDSAADTILYFVASLGAGYLLGGTWQTAVGALLVQFLIAKNTSAFMEGQVKIARFMKGTK
jgi:hypothetical protein